jgi:hypothetical protein
MGNKQKNLKRRIEKPPEENDEGDSGQESVESEVSSILKILHFFACYLFLLDFYFR